MKSLQCPRIESAESEFEGDNVLCFRSSTVLQDCATNPWHTLLCASCCLSFAVLTHSMMPCRLRCVVNAWPSVTACGVRSRLCSSERLLAP
eukprot:5891870-Amphidinium_carterae.2